MAASACSLALAGVLTTGLAAAGELPVIDYLERTTIPLNGRVSVHGSHFEQTGQIHVAGLPALVIPIPGTNSIEMNAYLPEGTPYGMVPVTVTTSAGTSNAVMLEVVPVAPQGRELWRFTMNSQTMLHRPALAADGTIYAKSAAGDLVALSPQGELQWLHQLGSDWTPEIDVGPDGTIYTADGWPRVHAVNPDGTTKWIWTDPLPSQGVIAGPNVGPDGNLYVVTHAPGTGVVSLAPDGSLRWDHAAPEYTPIGQQGQQIVFGDTQLFFCQDGNFDSFDFDGDKLFDANTITQHHDSSPQPAVGPGGDSYVEEWGRLKSYDPDGNLNWIAFDVGGSYLRDPDVGPDGTIYVVRNVFNTFWALNPDGSEKWSYNHPDSLLHPAVDPAGDLILVSGAGVGLEGPGFFLALDPDGHPLWEFTLPIEEYPFIFQTVKVFPQGRARFTPDGSVAYVMATGPSGYPGHGYLYALQVGPVADVGHALPGSAGLPRLECAASTVGGGGGPLNLSIALSQVPPGAPVWLVASSSVLAAPLLGGVLIPAPTLVVPIDVDASGTVQLSGNLPNSLPSGASLYVQFWMPDAAGPAGYAASNALSIIKP
jgi:outer membrane protein assembly factor BamB